MQNQSGQVIRKLHSQLSCLELTQLLDKLDKGQFCHSNPIQIKLTRLYLISHPQLISLIKNQSSLIKKIFTYQNTQLLISYLTYEHEENLQQIEHNFARFKEIQKYPLSLRLPYTAMQILSSQSHLITSLLFEGISQNLAQNQNKETIADKKQPLIKKIFQFLNYHQHYLLAGYFSKVILSITKRVYSTNHKYNQLFCQLIFGSSTQTMEQSFLFKTINHLYSGSTIDYILRWLSISTKTNPHINMKNSQEFMTQMPASTVDFKRTIKQKFLITLLDKLNKKQLSNQILSNIPILFQQLFSQQSSNNIVKIPQNIMISFGTKKQQKKLSLYQLSTNLKILKYILQPCQYEKLSIAKIKIMKDLVVKYKAEFKHLSQSSDNTEQNSKIEYNLFQKIEVQDFQEIIIWIFLLIKNLVQKGEDLNKQEKMLMLHLIQLLFQIHTVEILEEIICSYYNDNKDQLVEIIVKIMKINNNLIQIAQSKLIKFVLGVNRISKTKKCLIPFEFATKLLLDGIISIIDINGVREHVIQWAQIILDFQKQHIFQNYRQQSQWDHVTEIIQYQKQISIGNYQFYPSNLDIFYSRQKAMLVHSNFMETFNILVQYQDKESKQSKQNKKQSQLQLNNQKQQSSKREKQNSQNQNKTQTFKCSETPVMQQKQIQISQHIQDNSLSFQQLRMHYLNFDVNHLLQQL